MQRPERPPSEGTPAEAEADADRAAAIEVEHVRRAPFGHPTVGERGGDTRRRILTATLEVIADIGFDATHVEVIAERAGCSRPSFYQYFSSKHDVFWSLAASLGEEIVTLADQLEPVTPDQEGVRRLSAWISQFMQLHLAWEPVFSSFQAASRDHLPEARRSSGVSLRTDAALLRAFGLDGEGIEERLMGALVAVLDRSSFYRERAGPSLDAQPLIDALAQLCHRVVLGPIEGVNVHHGRPVRRRRYPLSPLVLEERELLPERRERVRQRLLDAGLEVLPARGYHDSRVDDIARAAGVSHGTFYRYFDGKDHFLQVLAEGAAGRAIGLLDQLELQAPIEELRAWCTEWLHTYRSDGGIISTWQEMGRNVELKRFSGEVASAMFTRLVAQLERRGFGNPEVDATSLLALLERLPNNVYVLGFTSETDGIDILVTILRRGYLGEPAAPWPGAPGSIRGSRR